MYKNFFGLKANPFNAKPDPRYFFVTKHAREALSCLVYGVLSRKGFVLLTGEVGTGKTMLLNVLVKWLRLRSAATAFISNPRLGVSEFFDYMLMEFGIDCQSHDKSRLLQRLNHWLLERDRAGQTAVLIIDEAQDLSDELLEEIRLLTNLENTSEKLLQVVFSGQLGLEERLKQPSLRQLRQRIALRCRTHRLEPAETGDYILQRLRVAGADGAPIFTAEAVEAVRRYGGGIQRLTNLLCEHALISAFADQKRLIAEEFVEEIAREFELDESASTASPAAASNGVSEAKQAGNWIHDALQRAEQEKLAASAANTRVNQAESWEKEADAIASITGPAAETPPVDALLAAVQQPGVSTATDMRDQINEVAPSPWSPDLRRLLFSSTNGHMTVGATVGEEEFRTLRSRLYRIREKRPLKALLVGSAVAGEGKTFVTGNLGLVLARQHSRRVLMIDCDLRKPELHTWFGASGKPGVTEYLRGSADEAAILQRSPKENLYLIPAGEKVSNPAELLGNGRLNTLVERIGPAFDWIVFDAPPILPVADASQIATLCDGVLLVVLAGSTSSELAQRAQQEFRHAPVLGVILNQVSKNQIHASYHYNCPPPEAKTK